MHFPCLSNTVGAGIYLKVSGLFQPLYTHMLHEAKNLNSFVYVYDTNYSHSPLQSDSKKMNESADSLKFADRSIFKSDVIYCGVLNFGVYWRYIGIAAVPHTTHFLFDDFFLRYRNFPLA